MWGGEPPLSIFFMFLLWYTFLSQTGNIQIHVYTYICILVHTKMQHLYLRINLNQTEPKRKIRWSGEGWGDDSENRTAIRHGQFSYWTGPPSPPLDWLILLVFLCIAYVIIRFLLGNIGDKLVKSFPEKLNSKPNAECWLTTETNRPIRLLDIFRYTKAPYIKSKKLNQSPKLTRPEDIKHG